MISRKRFNGLVLCINAPILSAATTFSAVGGWRLVLFCCVLWCTHPAPPRSVLPPSLSSLLTSLFSNIIVLSQKVVFVLHGLPHSSEKFYDLSGSFTHFALVAASVMAGGTKLRSPRQLGIALVSVVWMTRLGKKKTTSMKNSAVLLGTFGARPRPLSYELWACYLRHFLALEILL